MHAPFSYNDYKLLLDDIKHAGTLCDYADARERDSFIILRHDVEFSPARAYDLARFESENGVTSTYFFQLTNNAYNVLSGLNISRLREILGMGHRIGLHFHVHEMKDRGIIAQRIIEECAVLSSFLGMDIDCFSFHRPPSFVLEHPISLDKIINAYGSEYFTYSENPKSLDPTQSIKYVADSCNRWNYVSPWDRPCFEMFEKFPKVQILCHPYSWSECGADTLSNLRNVIAENRAEFVQTLDDETKYVKDYLDEL